AEGSRWRGDDFRGGRRRSIGAIFRFGRSARIPSHLSLRQPATRRPLALLLALVVGGHRGFARRGTCLTGFRGQDSGRSEEPSWGDKLGRLYRRRIARAPANSTWSYWNSRHFGVRDSTVGRECSPHAPHEELDSAFQKSRPHRSSRPHFITRSVMTTLAESLGA